MLKRFESKYAVEPKSGCWLWIASRCGNKRYGKIFLNGRLEVAHRVSWMLHFGAIPKKVFVCHKCDVTLCVNPSHLFLGTPRDNVMDCRKKGRAFTPKAIGESNGASKLTKGEILLIRNDHRSLRDIARDYNVSFTNIGYIKRGETWKHELSPRFGGLA